MLSPAPAARTPRVYSLPVLDFITRAAAVALAWGAAGLLLGWPYLPDRWRRALALAASLLGLGFLLVALNTEGVREASSVSGFLLGAAFVHTRVSASASVPWYLLTAVCLLLGVAGLALGERAAESLRRRFFWSAVGLTCAVALLRFAFEKAAAPMALARLFGVVWLAPVVGAFLLRNLEPDDPRASRLTRALLAYALLTRGFVVGLYAVVSALRLGTHFDITPVTRARLPGSAGVIEFASGSALQFATFVLVPQMTLWVGYTLLAGWCGALLAGRAHFHAARRPW